MGTYIEEIYTPYGPDEVRARLNRWKDAEGKGFKLVRSDARMIEIKHRTIHFILTLFDSKVRVEAWVGDLTKYSISPSALVGGMARRRGWRYYQTLKSVLSAGVEPGSLM
ncbi:MAG: hypothetical protein HXY34_04690 [Candidatus Thorarchaeota archaeon]|nr:hypothetical protein [Candidatus Thorarchaeota archaeon]